MKPKLIDKGITVAEDYIEGTVYVEYDNTDRIVPFKKIVTDWWRRADDNYEAIEIFEIKDRSEWETRQKLMTVEKSMQNLIRKHLEEEA